MKLNEEYSKFSEEDIKTVFENQSGRCYRCGKELKYENHTTFFDRKKKDHWSAHRFVDSAAFNADNCVILCNDCGKKYTLNLKYLLSPKRNVIDSTGDIQGYKSVGLGIVLSLLLGTLGFLYTSVKFAIIGILAKALAIAIYLILNSMQNSVLGMLGLIVLIIVLICTNRLTLAICSAIILGHHNSEIRRLSALKHEYMKNES